MFLIASHFLCSRLAFIRCRTCLSSLALSVCLSGLVAPFMSTAAAQSVFGDEVPFQPQAHQAPESTSNALAADALVAETSGGVPASLSVNEEPLSAVFRALSSHLQQAVSVSPKAGRYKVSGRFDLGKPMAMIAQLSRDLGLLW